MAEEVSELVVKLRPDGAEETQAALQDTSDEFERSADETERAASELSGFSRKFKGAALVLVGAIATLAAGILSKVPVLKESASAIGAVFTALGAKLSEDLRPRVTAFNRKLLETAGAVFRAEGFVDGLAKAFLGTAEALNLLLFGSETGAGLNMMGRIVREQISQAVDAVAGLPGAFLDIFNQIAGDIEHFLNTKIPAFKAGIGGIVDFISGLKTDIVNAMISAVLNPIIRKVNKGIGFLNKLPNVNIGTVGTVDTPSQITDTGSASSVQQAQTEAQRNAQTIMGNLDTSVNIDGRTVAESTKPFTVRGALSRGRASRLG